MSEVLKTASGKPDSPAEREEKRAFPDPKAGAVREVGTLITLIDKPETFREKERESKGK